MGNHSDDDELRDFFCALGPRLLRFVFVRTDAAPDHVEEIVQNVLLDAWRSRSSFSGASTLEAWVRSIARHKIVDYWRRRMQRPGANTLAVEDALARIEVTRIPDAVIDQVETRRQVARALDRLPPAYAQVLGMRYLDGLSVPEIADRLGETPSAVESRLSRARDAFRQQFLSLEAAHDQPRA